MKPARFYADLAAQRSCARLRTPTGLTAPGFPESSLREYRQLTRIVPLAIVEGLLELGRRNIAQRFEQTVSTGS